MRMIQTGRWVARKISEFLSVPNDNPELTRAQYEAFSKQVPLLYFILAVNTLAVSWTHINTAPAWLDIYIPLAMVAIFVFRGLGWYRRHNVVVDADEAYRQLRSTNRLAGPLALVCVAWSLMLMPLGNPYQQAHVAFYIAITVIGIIFCLMHLRSAALIVTCLVNAPFLVFMLLHGEPIFNAIGINFLLVCMAMVVVLQSHYRDFRQLGQSRLVLQDQNAAMQALSDENLRLANMDSLTLLANRRSFFHDLLKEFDAAKTNSTALAVGVIDLDGFKPINDMHGHSAGDKVLVEVARRLEIVAEGKARVYRLGGDEFALLVCGVADEGKLSSFGMTFCDAIAERISIGAGNVHVTGSLGIAIYPKVGTNGHELYDRADYALYTAKRRQRAGVMIFNAAQADELSRLKVVEEALLCASLEDELSLVFQPIVDVNSNSCVGFEALSRWDSPTIGSVSPAEFIPVAEHNGRILTITRLVLERALQTASTWPGDCYLSFNLSPHDLASAEGILRIIGIVHASGFDPARINFEITETAIMHDFDQAKASITLLRNMGAGISLDDFGTGYSSLSHVHHLPLSKIKIDGSFVQEIEQRDSSYKIVKSVLALCADMDIDAIVEGVETLEQLKILKSLGVQAVQGYYFSRPVSADDTVELLLSDDRMPVAARAS
ncbi:putative bifunctional diguanylate cyclase/phosphodiesterase [Agrobacterium sp. ES01]|uniref:putative bifunctional diguanylate cyclase/phosphodiesterase n=1 Tax=Agrobacterium sp. ES01 TaxID=3420714 RepID=UPI003D0A807D